MKISNNLWFFYSSFSGRSGRLEFGIYFSIYIAFQVLMLSLFSQVNLDNKNILNLFYIYIIILIIFIPMQAVTTRRLRDIGINPSLVFINFIPVLSMVFKIYLSFAKQKLNNIPNGSDIRFL